VKLGCDVVSISTDKKFTHLAWREQDKDLARVSFQMGSDPTGRIGRVFGVYDDASGFTLRGTFLISPDLRLLNSEVNFYNLGRNIDELLRKLKANVFMSRKVGESCPSTWKNEGDRTLTPPAPKPAKG
jgi:peroxiredoxin (alkyl hydroperoxide reductase subunit C)